MSILQYLINIHLPFDPVIPHIEVYPDFYPSDMQKSVYTSLFIEALLVILKYCKQ